VKTGTEQGHEKGPPPAASPNTGRGFANDRSEVWPRRLGPREVVVDVLEPLRPFEDRGRFLPSFEIQPHIPSRTRKESRVRPTHVLRSSVGRTDRYRQRPFISAQSCPRRAIETSGHPYTIPSGKRSFFEFLAAIALAATTTTCFGLVRPA